MRNPPSPTSISSHDVASGAAGTCSGREGALSSPGGVKRLHSQGQGAQEPWQSEKGFLQAGHPATAQQTSGEEGCLAREGAEGPGGHQETGSRCGLSWFLHCGLILSSKTVSPSFLITLSPTNSAPTDESCCDFAKE